MCLVRRGKRCLPPCAIAAACGHVSCSLLAMGSAATAGSSVVHAARLNATLVCRFFSFTATATPLPSEGRVRMRFVGSIMCGAAPQCVFRTSVSCDVISMSMQVCTPVCQRTEKAHGRAFCFRSESHLAAQPLGILSPGEAPACGCRDQCEPVKGTVHYAVAGDEWLTWMALAGTPQNRGQFGCWAASILISVSPS